MRKIIFSFLLFIPVLFIFSCAKKEKIPSVPMTQKQTVELPVHYWYYFQMNDDGSVHLKTTSAVTAIPPVPFKPWTEAVRTADITIAHSPLFLINKCGLYTPDHLKPETRLPVQHEFFSRTTAGNIYTVDNRYFIRIYQNSVFSPDKQLNNDCFLLRTDTSTAFYTPAATTRHLQLPVTAQCKAIEEINGEWYASFKADSGNTVSFFYIKCKNFTAFTKTDAFMHAEHISSENFRAACKPAHYEKMPHILKELTDRISSSSALYIRVFTKDNTCGTVFFKPESATPPSSIEKTEEKNTVEAEAHALYYTRKENRHSAAILLPDGTLFLNTTEYGIQQHRLPVLPENFIYTHFFISDTRIWAAWEETAFYKVGRSGFFTAELHELTP